MLPASPLVATNLTKSKEIRKDTLMEMSGVAVGGLTAAMLR
jgi:hypothetical protein